MKRDERTTLWFVEVAYKRNMTLSTGLLVIYKLVAQCRIPFDGGCGDIGPKILYNQDDWSIEGSVTVQEFESSDVRGKLREP